MNDAELDRLLADLGGVEPPRALQARILAEVGVPPGRVAEVLGGPALVVAPRPDAAQQADVASGSPGSWGGGRAPRNAPPILRRWAPVAAGVFALAAGLLLALPTPAERGDPAQLVPRGAGERVPELGLRVAVRRGDAVERLSAGRSYRSGDTLVFRVTTQVPMDVTLRRNDTVLFRGPVPAGDTDLPVGYALEAGEGPARFVVEGGGASDAIELPGVTP